MRGLVRECVRELYRVVVVARDHDAPNAHLAEAQKHGCDVGPQVRVQNEGQRSWGIPKHARLRKT